MSKVIFFGTRYVPGRSDPKVLGKYKPVVQKLVSDGTRRVVCFDRPGFLVEFSNLAAFGRNSILIRIEPRVVNPRQYGGLTAGLYGKVIGGANEDGRGSYWSTWYEEMSGMTTTQQFEPYDIGIIASRRLSLVVGENYSLRSRAIEALANQKLRVLVTGSGWGRNSIKEALSALSRSPRGVLVRGYRSLLEWFTYRPQVSVNYQGYVSDSASHFSMVRACLVIENTSTYSSEKLIQAVSTGKKVIYVGDFDYLPSSNCFCFRAFRNGADLIASIEDGTISRILSQPTSCKPHHHAEVQTRINELTKLERQDSLLRELDL